MFYFDKSDPRVIFGDRRTVEPVALGEGRNERLFEVTPDMLTDFRALDFPDASFSLVIFDPPHSTRAGHTGWLATKYGTLTGTDWRADLRAGFAECFRVLKPHGTLAFKWAETDIPLREVLALTDEKPVVGEMLPKRSGTHWVLFLKADRTYHYNQEG